MLASRSPARPGPGGSGPATAETSLRLASTTSPRRRRPYGEAALRYLALSLPARATAPMAGATTSHNPIVATMAGR